MKKLLLSSALLLTVMAANAQRWSDSATVNTRVNATIATPTKFKAWVPSGVTTPKGILLASGAAESMVSQGVPFSVSPAIRQAATSNQLILVSFNTQLADTGIAISFDPTLGHSDSLNKALSLLGTRLQVANMSALPVIAYGQGKGAWFAQHYGMFATSRIAAVISYHGFTINTPSWVNTAPYSPTVNSLKNVPHAVVSGELEGPELFGNRRPYLADTMRRFVLQRRAQGELVHQVVEMNGNHYHVHPKGMSYLATFISKTVQLRLQTPGTITALTEAGGHLGRVTTNYLFEASNYANISFNAGQAATSHWLYDAQHGQVWSAFHQAGIRIGIQPPPLPVAPYVSGRNVSGMVVTYDLADRTFRSFADSNIFKVELSNALGDFSNRTFPGLIAGSTRRRDTTGFTASSGSTGFLEVALPDNLQYDILKINTTRPRYRVRLLTTAPALESHNGGEIGDFVIGDEYNMWLNALPAGTVLEKGKSVRLTLNKLAAFNPGANNRFLVQLSDTAGTFNAPILIKDTAATFPGNVLQLRADIPANILSGYKYRIRIKTTSPVDSSSNNGSDLIIGNVFTGLAFNSNEPVTALPLSVYPNPAEAVLTARLDFDQATSVSYVITDARGVQMISGQSQKSSGYQELSIATDKLTRGIYLLNIKAGNKRYSTRFVK